jgi:hypothetical protein
MARPPSRNLKDVWIIQGVLKAMPAAVAAAGIACAPFASALASDGISRDLVVAQASTAPPPLGPVPPPPQSNAPPPPPEAPSASASSLWGAIGFTADGSFSSAWKMAAKPDAEADVAKRCAGMGRGSCEVISFSGHQCAALATYIGYYGGRRWKLSFTSGGITYPDAQKAAMDRCNSDQRTRGRCQLRTAVCADGR